MSLSPSQQQRFANDNVIEAIREHARWQNPCELIEEDGMIMMAGSTGFPGAFKNCVARIDPTLPASVMLARAEEFFGGKNRSFSVFVLPGQDSDLEQQLQQSAYLHRFDWPCMNVYAPVTEPVLAAGLRLEAIATRQHNDDAVAVLADAYQPLGLEPEETRAYFSRTACLAERQVIGCIVYRDAQPLACALVIQNDEVAGIYWVGTSPAAQRMGLATVCTAHLTNAAFARGAPLVTLQASTLGEPVYRRLGFDTYGWLKVYRFAGAAQ